MLDNSYQGDVYVDPITGFVTTIDPPTGGARPKSPNVSNNSNSTSPASTSNKPSPKMGPRSGSSDLIGSVLGNQNSLSSRQGQSLKSNGNGLLSNIRTPRRSNDIDNISTHVSSQAGSPRSSLQGESPRSSLHRTSVESDSEV